MKYFQISLTIFFLFLITGHEAVAPLFLQAITSALATIPLIGGPMTTGLVGAKLGIGTKLLYYLGFFGRRSRSTPKKKSVPKTPLPKAAAGLQPVPLPYAVAGGFPQQMGGMGGPFGGGFQQMSGFGGGFDQMGGGGGFQQAPFGGINPAQMFAALRAQGYDANTAMQLMNYGGGSFGMGGGFMPGQDFESGAGSFMPQVPQSQFPQFPGKDFPDKSSSLSDSRESLPHEHPEEHPEVEHPEEQESDDIEGFFNFLKDMDDNTCISRLICDIGASPSFLGDFSENIHSIVGSLDVEPTSGAFPYIEIMETGRKDGECHIRFRDCTDGAYEIVKSVAPSVGVPQNLNIDAINRL